MNFIKPRSPRKTWNRIGLVLCFALLISCQQKEDLNDPLEAGWKGEPVCELLQENEQIRVLKCTFPPGVGHEKHFHAAHYGYTLDGSTFRITDDKGVREIEVPTGSDFFNEGIEWHEVLNIGEDTAVFLIIEPK